MGGKRQYKARDYAVGEQVLALRMRADLRQAELAALLQVSQRSIHNWENGEAYPSEVHLRQLLALAQQRGLFTPGHEHQEAAHLWTLVAERISKPLGAFDPAWFASLPHPEGATPLMAGTSLPAAAHERLVDWGEAPDTSSFHGRTAELATLRSWIGAERVRLVALLGMGGIGKTSLAAQLARELAPAFEAIYWRSLRNAPPVEEWLAGAIGLLSDQQRVPPAAESERLLAVLQLLRARRCLLVLDNVETLFEPLQQEGRYRAALAGYGRRLLAEQVARSAAAEQQVLRLLAVEREGVRLAEMLAALSPRVSRGAVLEAVEELRRRSLIERAEMGGAAALTLQSVVLEYVTDRLVADVAEEIQRGQPLLLVEQPLIKALAKDYVRQTQERLIGAPILQQLNAQQAEGGTEQRLLGLLEGWRAKPAAEQGYAPGNVVNLLRLLRGDLCGLDLSRLALRQTYLAEVDAQDASLVDAHLAETVLAEAFDFPGWVTLSGDGAWLAAGTTTGQVWLWRGVDRTPLWAVQGHTGAVWA